MEKSFNANANEPFNKTASTARSASNVATDAKSAIMDKAAPAMDYLKDNFETVRETTAPYLKDAEAMVRRHPFYALAGAVAVGAIFGAMIARPARID